MDFPKWKYLRITISISCTKLRKYDQKVLQLNWLNVVFGSSNYKWIIYINSLKKTQQKMNHINQFNATFDSFGSCMNSSSILNIYGWWWCCNLTHEKCLVFIQVIVISLLNSISIVELLAMILSDYKFSLKVLLVVFRDDS